MKPITNSSSLRSLPYIRLLALLWLSISVALPAWAALPDESLVEVTYHVKVSGNDTNSGTSATSPFRTVGKALAMANNDGQHSKILIYPGTYREGDLQTEAKASTDAKLLVIEGTEKGKVILTGSDAYPASAWTNEGNGVYSISWDKDWYFWDGNWGKSGPRNVLGHRREMVFVDGVLLGQVMIEDWTYTYQNVTGKGIGSWTYNSYTGPSALTEGSYGVSDLSYGARQGKLFIKLPAGKSISTAKIEVAARTNGLLIRKSNTVVRNLIIEHYASKIPRVDGTYALGWYKQDYYQWREENALQNSLVEDCEIRWNNGDGISPLGHLNNTFRNSSSHHNGGNGGTGAYVGYSDWSDLEFSDNNWRVSGYGGKDSWFVAGIKFWCTKYMNFTKISTFNNRGAGFWDDGNSFNNVWKHCELSGNKVGLFIEISEGPSVVDSCTLSENRESGLHISLARHTRVTHNQFINNQEAGMTVVAKNKDRLESFPSEFKGPNLVFNADGKAAFNAEDVDFYDNVITTNQGAESYMIQPNFQYGGDASWNTNVLDGWEGDRNTYYNPDNEQVFWLNGSTATDLAGWKDRLSAAQTGQSTSQEVNSVWGAAAAPGETWLEAECSAVGDRWDIKTSSQAAGGKYLEAKTGNNAYNYSPKNAEDQLQFTFTVPAAGSYKIWGRVKCATDNDDSFWVQVDGGAWTQWNNLNNGGVWTWNDVHETRNGGQAITYNLSAGSHTLKVGYREDGAQLDKLVVTNTGQAPNGLGGEAANCLPPFEDLTLEAEEATLSRTIVESNHAGYTGNGFVNYDNVAGSYVEWEVSVPSAGQYQLSFRYANGSTVNRPCAIRVNGTVVNSGLLFSPTGAWTSYQSSSSVMVSLNAGQNTVRATATGGDGGPNMDHLAVSSLTGARTSGPVANKQEATIESEAGQLQLYPNPTTGVVQLKGEVSGPVQVYSLEGKLLLRSQLSQQQEVDVSALPVGVYMLEVQGQGQPFRARIIKR